MVFVAGLIWAASASAGCNPGRPQYHGSYQDGWALSALTCITGSQADIYNGNPYVYSGATPSTVWTMIDNNGNSYGQIGYQVDSSGTRKNFYEYNDADTGYLPVDKTWGSSPIFTSPNYKITYSSDYFHMFVDGVNYWNVSSPSFVGCYAEQAAEIHNKDSQMPGIVSNHETIDNFQVRDNSGWNSNAATYPYNDNTSWFGQAFDPLDIETWDKACS